MSLEINAKINLGDFYNMLVHSFIAILPWQNSRMWSDWKCMEDNYSLKSCKKISPFYMRGDVKERKRNRRINIFLWHARSLTFTSYMTLYKKNSSSYLMFYSEFGNISLYKDILFIRIWIWSLYLFEICYFLLTQILIIIIEFSLSFVFLIYMREKNEKNSLNISFCRSKLYIL